MSGSGIEHTPWDTLLLLFGTVSTVALEFRMNNAASTPSNMQAKVACSPGGILTLLGRLSFSFRFVLYDAQRIRVEHIIQSIMGPDARPQ
jgi:hypothetical protein